MKISRRGLAFGVIPWSLLVPRSLRAANVKLFLKDGTYQLVREFQVLPDRVRYYSVERGDWEEIPIDLADLGKTQGEIQRREQERREEAKALAEEDQAERAAANEIKRIPKDPGVYLIAGDELKAIKQAEPKVVNNKGRHVLKLISPVPMVTDKSWLELDGAHSPNVTTEARPEFYFRPINEERFGIVHMGEHRGNRVVEKLSIVPVTKDVIEEPELVDIFRRQVGGDLYKIWPEKPLAPGEYGVIEYTDGKVNVTVWDFAYAPK